MTNAGDNAVALSQYINGISLRNIFYPYSLSTLVQHTSLPVISGYCYFINNVKIDYYHDDADTGYLAVTGYISGNLISLAICEAVPSVKSDGHKNYNVRTLMDRGTAITFDYSIGDWNDAYCVIQYCLIPLTEIVKAIEEQNQGGSQTAQEKCNLIKFILEGC